MTASIVSCAPPSRIEPCCRKASPCRSRAEPTTLHTAISTSPPTGCEKQAESRLGGLAVGRVGARVASAPRDRSAAAAHGVHQEVLHFTASAYASTGGHTHTRLRSPYAPSTRPTDGHTLWRRVDGDGNAARSRE